MKSQKGSIFIFILIAVLTGLTVTLVNLKVNRKESIKPAPAQNTNVNNQKTGTIPATLPKTRRVALYKKTDTGDVKVFEKSIDEQPEVLLWKSNLIFATAGSYEQSSNILMYDSNTNEVKTLLNLDDFRNQHFEHCRNDGGYINDKMLVKDKLYISYGGYLCLFPIFWIDLVNPTQVEQTEEYYPNATLNSLDDKLWVVSGEGDGPWSFTTFTQLNSTNLKPIQSLAINAGVDNGERILFSDDKKLVTLSYERTRTDENSTTFKGESFSSLNSYYFTNLKNKMVLYNFSKSFDYPSILEGKNEVLFKNNAEIYRYNFSNNQMVFLNEMPNTYKRVSWLDENKLCFSKDSGGPYLLKDINTWETIEECSTACEDHIRNSRPTDEEKWKDVLDSLNLPDDYYYVIDE